MGNNGWTMTDSFEEEVNILEWLDHCSENSKQLIVEFVKNDPEPIFSFDFEGTAVYPEDVNYHVDEIVYFKDEVRIDVKHLFDDASIAKISESMISNYGENQYQKHLSQISVENRHAFAILIINNKPSFFVLPIL